MLDATDRLMWGLVNAVQERRAPHNAVSIQQALRALVDVLTVLGEADEETLDYFWGAVSADPQFRCGFTELAEDLEKVLRQNG